MRSEGAGGLRIGNPVQGHDRASQGRGKVHAAAIVRNDQAASLEKGCKLGQRGFSREIQRSFTDTPGHLLTLTSADIHFDLDHRASRKFPKVKKATTNCWARTS